jgi:hypothetical protein
MRKSGQDGTRNRPARAKVEQFGGHLLTISEHPGYTVHGEYVFTRGRRQYSLEIHHIMVRPKQPTSPSDLTRLEREALVFIVDYITADPFRRAPSQAELLVHLNRVIPRRPGNKPALVSTQQTHRLASKLRAKGMLVTIKGFVRVQRNMVPTQLGEHLAREIRLAKGQTEGH